MNGDTMNNTTQDPITTQERVLVRSTATGFEQAIAAMAGLLTAGPMGALASWGALRGLQGKWAPWFILGVPSALVLNLVQLVLLGMILSTGEAPPEAEETYNPISIEQIVVDA